MTSASDTETTTAAPRQCYDVVVSLGTDHHPFDRLLDWMQDYLQQHPDVRALIQHGFTTPCRAGDHVARMPREELLELYRNSTAVVVQGGPGSILDAREAGVVPVTVPRVAELGEVVDDHQVQFTAVMHSRDDAVRAETREELFAALDRALADPDSVRTSPREPHSAEAAAELGRNLELLLQKPPSAHGRFRRRLKQLFSRPDSPARTTSKG